MLFLLSFAHFHVNNNTPSHPAAGSSSMQQLDRGQDISYLEEQERGDNSHVTHSLLTACGLAGVHK